MHPQQLRKSSADGLSPPYSWVLLTAPWVFPVGLLSSYRAELAEKECHLPSFAPATGFEGDQGVCQGCLGAEASSASLSLVTSFAPFLFADLTLVFLLFQVCLRPFSFPPFPSPPFHSPSLLSPSFSCSSSSPMHFPVL